MEINYYTNGRNACEVDFIVDNGANIIPLEGKAEINLKAKRLKTYREKFTPEVSICPSMAVYSEEVGLINLPLHAIEGIE